MSYGLLATGFLPKRLETCKAELIDALKTAFGQNLKTDDESIFGQLASIQADREADLWALLELVYHAAYLSGATGASLDEVIALAGQTRGGATYSLVTLTLGGDDGTVIPIGSITWDPVLEIDWIHQTAATIAGGTASCLARAATTGPVQGLAGTIDTIKTPITGWNTATNAEDAAIGQNAQSDASVRRNFLIGMRLSGGSSAEGVVALLIKPGIVPGLVEAICIQNESLLPDADGRPGKSFEVVTRGGDAQLIANLIWFAKPAGIETTGDESTDVIAADGSTQTVHHTFAAELEVWILVEYAVDGEGPAFPGDPWTATDLTVEHAATDGTGETEMRDAILDLGPTYTLGRDLKGWHIKRAIETIGIGDLTVKVGLSSSPSNTTPVSVGPAEYASIDSSRITFKRVT